MTENCCPVCGCPLVEIGYSGKDPKRLALMKRKDFCGYMGCTRTDLHEGGKVFVRPIFHPKVWRHDPISHKRGKKLKFFTR